MVNASRVGGGKTGVTINTENCELRCRQRHILIASRQQGGPVSKALNRRRPIAKAQRALAFTEFPKHLVVIVRGTSGWNWRRMAPARPKLRYSSSWTDPTRMDAGGGGGGGDSLGSAENLSKQGLEFRLGSKVRCFHRKAKTVLSVCRGRAITMCRRVIGSGPPSPHRRSWPRPVALSSTKRLHPRQRLLCYLREGITRSVM